MKTEKRKAKVGERILITNAQMSMGKYKVGDILTVEKSIKESPKESGHVFVQGIGVCILDTEYEVIVDETEADNVVNVNFRGMSLGELEEFVQKAVKELSKRAFHSGFRDGREAQRKSDGKRDERKKSPQQRRDEIIEKAKRDVAHLIDRIYKRSDLEATWLYGHLRTKFVVNKEKRTIVALLKGRYTEIGKVLRGIAKCAPDDCFNVHIGKAIALRRALGLEVPDEYLNAPQPTEVRVGDIIEYKGKRYTVSKAPLKNGQCGVNSIAVHNGKIIDDTREGCVVR